MQQVTTARSPAGSPEIAWRPFIALCAAAITLTGVLLVNASSIANFAWYFCLWNAFILICHREQLNDFTLAFLVNSAFVALFVLVQSTVYPDTYGTTSPLSMSWTDDSYFFSLVADSVQADLLTRPGYWEYADPFTLLIRTVTPLPIEHPLDVLFFQSGTAALLASFSAKLMLQLSRDRQLAVTVLVFTMICPFLMMNGGVIFLRDTLSAALLVYSLCAINDRRIVTAAVTIALQLAIRPGTGIILMFAYPAIYFREAWAFLRHNPGAAAALAAVLVLAGIILFPYAFDYLSAHYDIGAMSFLGREVFAELSDDPSINAFFLAVQDLPFIIKLPLNAAYMFMYPFFIPNAVAAASQFDLRTLLMGVVIPVYSLWLNAWFFAGVLCARRAVIDRQRALVIAIVVILMLIGTYSLQTRHKTIIYPLYYILIAIGFAKAGPAARRAGYVLSAALLLIQVARSLSE
jgi:hypothetical protein